MKSGSVGQPSGRRIQAWIRTGRLARIFVRAIGMFLLVLGGVVLYFMKPEEIERASLQVFDRLTLEPPARHP